MQRNILYHSYTYLGQTFEDDELRHWKYISKERKNGRWVYTYKNDKYENSKQSLNNAKQNYDKKMMNYAVADSNVQVNGKMANFLMMKLNNMDDIQWKEIRVKLSMRKLKRITMLRNPNIILLLSQHYQVE